MGVGGHPQRGGRPAARVAAGGCCTAPRCPPDVFVEVCVWGAPLLGRDDGKLLAAVARQLGGCGAREKGTCVGRASCISTSIRAARRAVSMQPWRVGNHVGAAKSKPSRTRGLGVGVPHRQVARLGERPKECPGLAPHPARSCCATGCGLQVAAAPKRRHELTRSARTCGLVANCWRHSLLQRNLCPTKFHLRSLCTDFEKGHARIAERGTG